MVELDKIYNEDCLEGMKRMESESVDITVTLDQWEDGGNVNIGSDKFEDEP